MDTRFPNTVAHAAVATARQDLAPVRGAVRTDLAPPVAVAAQAGAEQSRFNRDRRPEMIGKQTQTSISADRDTGELIYRVMDKSGENVLAQYPYQSVLNLRAYIRATEEKAGE